MYIRISEERQPDMSDRGRYNELDLKRLVAQGNESVRIPIEATHPVFGTLKGELTIELELTLKTKFEES